VRDVTHIARTMLLQDMRLYDGLSITRRYFIEMAKHISKLFAPSGSHAIVVFPHKTVP